MTTDKCDFTNPRSIEEYSKRLIRKTFAQVVAEDIYKLKEGEWDKRYEELFEKVNKEWKNRSNKGYLGQIIEKHFFHYDPNSKPAPDFEEANLELKTTPYKQLSNGDIVAKERLSIAMIDYNRIVEESFEESHFWNKANLILLLYYKYSKDIINPLNYSIDYTSIFHPPDEDMPTIIHDYEIIQKKVREGKAHELSCSDTDYLEAAPKGADSSDKVKQPFSNELAMKRGFAFKVGYMTSILRRYIVPGISTWKEGTMLPKGNTTPLEEYVVNKVQQYSDKTMTELKKEFNVETNPKNLGSFLIFKILGVNGNQTEEFQKANIAVKVIRVGKNGKIKENMSFPAFKFKELAEEKWDTSTFGNYLRDTRFFFVVYKENEISDFVLKGGQFWNMPYSDLEGCVRSVWEKAVEVIKDGSSFKFQDGHFMSALPKSSENPVCHVRPHALNSSDKNELPNGKYYPKQCFWLHRDYIKSQLNKEFFE